MENTLENKSDIIFLKSKFFLFRGLIYFTFLLMPVWVQKVITGNSLMIISLMITYIFFMFGQWFLVGKEIDHRFKIYYRVNSSLDRLLYRVLLGMVVLMILFNAIAFLPVKWINNVFWGFWVLWGLFYSWPTRGKIIQESASSTFGEYRYLDRFEKTLLTLIILTFVVSIPELPKFESENAIRLYLDPKEFINVVYWEFIKVNYIPFYNYPVLSKLSMTLNFYVVGTSLMLLALYSLLRYFFSRRLALLGCFALISSWSFSKNINAQPSDVLVSSYYLIWTWSVFWVAKSSTYRSGLFAGLVAFYGVILNPSNIFLLPFNFILIYSVGFFDKTFWFKKQFARYQLAGVLLIFVWLLIGNVEDQFLFGLHKGMFKEWWQILDRKAFYMLAIVGAPLLAYYVKKDSKTNITKIFHDSHALKLLSGCVVCGIALNFVIPRLFSASSFSFMWMLIVFSLVPIELIFKSMHRFRSNRNMVYLIYIIALVLDGHFEGRLKIMLRVLKQIE